MKARPKRERKADRLLSPGSSPRDIECDYSLAPMDRLATEMDRKWGIERLPELVSVETARKYGVAMAHLNQCIEQGDPEKCAAAAGNCIRGLHAMDAEAVRSGRKPMPSEMVECEANGNKFGILRDPQQWQDLADARPEITLISPREAAIAIAFYRENFIKAAKQHFPGAKVVKMTPRKTPLEIALNDEIPF